MTFCIQPFVTGYPWPPLIVASAAAGLAIALAFKVWGRTGPISRAKARILARALELLLYPAEPRVVAGILGRICAVNGAYLRLVAVPLLVGAAMAVGAYAWAGAWTAVRPLRVGEAALVKARLAQRVVVEQNQVRLETPEGIVAEAGPLRIPARQEVDWRIRVTGLSPAAAWITVHAGGTEVRKTLAIEGARAGAAYPTAVTRLNDGPILRVEVRYPPRELALAGFPMRPWVACLLLTLCFAALAKRVLRVTF